MEPSASTLFVVPGIIKERPENYIAHKKLSFSIEFFTNKNVLGLFVITFLFFASNTVIIQMGTSIFVKSYHFSENTIGKLGMLQSIASLIYGVAVFKLIDKFNHKYILSISALGLCATYFYFFLFLHQGVNLLVLYAGVFVYGLFFIAGIICIYTIGSMVAPKDRLGEFIGWINIFIALPQTIFVYVFGYIIDVGHPHLPLFIAAIFYLIAFGVTMLLKLKSPNELS